MAKKKVLVINGTYRNGKTIDSLIDKTLLGVNEGIPSSEVGVIRLIEKDIKYCTNCMSCRHENTDFTPAKCVIHDDMQEIYEDLLEAEYYIFATPINMGSVTAVMKTFLERCCWVFAKPGKWPMKGCPVPRQLKKKNAVIILSTGIIPPIFRMWCDDATSMIKDFCRVSLNAKVVGSLYAGAVEKRGASYYSKAALKLGRKLLGK